MTTEAVDGRMTLIEHLTELRTRIMRAGLAAVLGIIIALAFYDQYRSAVLPANLLQAQRDYFGAHTYERVDMPGHFHTLWSEDRSEVNA